MRRFEQPQQLPPDLKVTRTYLFDGGCVTYEFSFEGAASTSLMFEADQALAFESRSELVAQVEDDRLAEVVADGRYLDSTREVLRQHGGLWFLDESYVISRRRA